MRAKMFWLLSIFLVTVNKNKTIFIVVALFLMTYQEQPETRGILAVSIAAHWWTPEWEGGRSPALFLLSGVELAPGGAGKKSRLCYQSVFEYVFSYINDWSVQITQQLLQEIKSPGLVFCGTEWTEMQLVGCTLTMATIFLTAFRPEVGCRKERKGF